MIPKRMDKEIEKYTQWLPEGDWLAFWEENGYYEIVKRTDIIEKISQFIEVDDHYESNKLIKNWRGFKTHKEARLYCLRFLRSWRDEMHGSVIALMALKKYD